MNERSTKPLKFAITGANGFVGRYVVDYFLNATSAHLLLLVRNANAISPLLRDHPRITVQPIFDLASPSAAEELTTLFAGVTAVFHLAARAHVMKDKSTNPQEEYDHHNVVATKNIAQACITQSVKRLVFLSSIKVNGESNEQDDQGRAIPYREDDTPAGNDPYAISKIKAEDLLRELGRQQGLSYTIIRPPLMYGPGVKANFRTLVKLVRSGLPLPFGSIENRRSMLFVGNLADAMLRCIDHPGADKQTFLISDGKDVSTADLIRQIAQAMNKSPVLVPVPPKLLKFTCTLAGKKSIYERLCGSLRVDSRKIMKALDWRPPFDMRQGLNSTVATLELSKAPATNQ